MIFIGYRPSVVVELLTIFNYDAKNKIFKGGIKTEAGINRPVAVHPYIQPFIDYFIELKGDNLFCRPDGSAYTLGNFREKHYYKCLKDIGVRKLPPRNCRTTCNTLMISHEVDEAARLQMMGHTDAEFNVKTYGGTDPTYLHRQMNKIVFTENIVNS